MRLNTALCIKGATSSDAIICGESVFLSCNWEVRCMASDVRKDDQRAGSCGMSSLRMAYLAYIRNLMDHAKL